MTSDLPFAQVWLVDFEFIAEAGEHPDVVCLVATEWRTGQTLRLWRDELDRLDAPPYPVDNTSLFVCFAATAELTCHLALGWPLPAKVLDLSPVFRCIMNGRAAPEGKGLLAALAYYGVSSIGAKRKEDMRARILQGWPFSREERKGILDYCASDVDALALLLPKLLPELELGIALHWSEFVAVSATMEHRGVPIDQDVYALLRDKNAWAFVRDAMVPEIDARYGVYVTGKDGEWHFSNERFETYLAGAGIDWPRIETGKLDMRQKTFEAMAKAWPELEDLRQLRYARNKMRRIKLAVGADGRNRTTLWPFTAKTSRTQPRASEWIFSPAVWLRSLIKPGPGRAVAYIDWSSMEFQVAAALSNSQPMLELYAGGSPYVDFAKRFDAAPPTATKKSHAETHETYKVALLGAQYRMQSETLARRLGVSTFLAHEMLGQHRGLFNQYWAWSEDWIAHALDTGVMRTPFGWTCRTGITEFNERSIGNWPVQATSADILRVSCIMMERQGIELLGTVHDAVLIEAADDRIEADVARAREIMRRASRIVLNADPNGPYELRADATIVRCPDRYTDKRGTKTWETVLWLLAQYQHRQEVAHAS